MKKSHKIIIGVILLVVVIIIFYLALRPKEIIAPTGNEALTTNNSNTMDQIKIETLKQGEGEVSKAGDTVTVNYVGTLEDGTKFDSSIDRNEPFSFTLGAGQVIEGWDQGLLGMKVGEKRKLTIPASLGYGNRATGPIPANSTLIFEVDLLKIN